MNCNSDKTMSTGNHNVDIKVNIVQLLRDQFCSIGDWLREVDANGKSQFYVKLFGLLVGIALPIVMIFYGIIASHLI